MTKKQLQGFALGLCLFASPATKANGYGGSFKDLETIGLIVCSLPITIPIAWASLVTLGEGYQGTMNALYYNDPELRNGTIRHISKTIQSYCSTKNISCNVNSLEQNITALVPEQPERLLTTAERNGMILNAWVPFFGLAMALGLPFLATAAATKWDEWRRAKEEIQAQKNFKKH